MHYDHRQTMSEARRREARRERRLAAAAVLLYAVFFGVMSWVLPRPLSIGPLVIAGACVCLAAVILNLEDGS